LRKRKEGKRAKGHESESQASDELESFLNTGKQEEEFTRISPKHGQRDMSPFLSTTLDNIPPTSTAPRKRRLEQAMRLVRRSNSVRYPAYGDLLGALYLGRRAKAAGWPGEALSRKLPKIRASTHQFLPNLASRRLQLAQSRSTR